jgi:hypothetical protein
MGLDEFKKRNENRWLVYKQLMPIIETTLKNIESGKRTATTKWLGYFNNLNKKVLNFYITKNKSKIVLRFFFSPHATKESIGKARQKIKFAIIFKESGYDRTDREVYECEFDFTDSDKEEKLKSVLETFSNLLTSPS